MKYLNLFFTLACIFNLAFVNAQSSFVDKRLKKVWETPEGLNVPESSCYNAENKIIYVSNIVGKPDAKDSMGYISKINMKGQFIEKEWVKGLNAPKGIGIAKGRLYVTDINEVVECDLKTGKILKKYSNKLVKRLNDVATDNEGRVYVSEMDRNVVYTVGKDSLEVFAESKLISRVNGVCDYFDEIILSSGGVDMIAIDKKTKKVRVLIEKTGYLDGIVVVDRDHIITSDFKGKVQLIEPSKNKIEVLINTTEANINAADLGFIPSKKILLVPTFTNNKVVAYKLKFLKNILK